MDATDWRAEVFLLTIDDGTWRVWRLAREEFSRCQQTGAQLTNDLVDLAITNTGSGGPPLEGWGSEVGRNNAASRWRQTGRPEYATRGRRRERPLHQLN